MHARVVLGVGKGVLFREVSSFQEYPHRERFYYAQFSLYAYILYLLSLHCGLLVGPTLEQQCC